MSAFYDLASLVLVPSGYKAEKVYAQKPLTTDGQLTFSRASTATRVNASGLIETVASNVPRLDYLGSTCPRLILEPQRTNLALYSEQFDNAAWTKTNATITANNAVSPDGYTNADKLVEDTSTGSHYINITTSIASATTNTNSIFIKSAGRQWVWLYDLTVGAGKYFDIINGVGGTAGAIDGYSITELADGWFRISITDAAASTSKISIWLAEADNDNSYTGDGTSGVYLWGAQLEAGAYATSYVNTLNSAVTRGADAASKTGISSLIGQTEGTLFVEFNVLNINPANVSRIILSDGTTDNYIFLGINESGSGNLSRLFINNTAASLSLSLFSSTAITVGRHKLALAYKSGSFALYLDGNSVATSATTGTIPPTSQLVIGGTSPTAVSNLETLTLLQSLLFPTRLTNAQLAELTAL